MATVKKKTEDAEAVQTAQNTPQDAPEAAEGTTTAQTAEMPQNVQETPQGTGGQQDSAEAAEVVKLAYVGPTLPRGQLKTNKIFEGGSREEILASPELEDVLKKYPLVAKMLVPVSKLAEAKAKAKTAGNALHKFYADIESLAAAERMEG